MIVLCLALGLRSMIVKQRGHLSTRVRRRPHSLGSAVWCRPSSMAWAPAPTHRSGPSLAGYGLAAGGVTAATWRVLGRRAKRVASPTPGRAETT